MPRATLFAHAKYRYSIELLHPYIIVIVSSLAIHVFNLPLSLIA